MDEFEDFYRANVRLVHALMLSRTGDRSQAEDLTQDTFLRAWRSFGDLVGLEAAYVSSPFSVQGEYIFANADVASSANFRGYYAQASYFLTGEHRNYKPSEGAFSRVKPKENFKSGGGPGAWEVALRYSGLDLDDNSITGGKLNDLTAGLNWYLNPNTRVMWNYVHADKDHVGNADMLMMRLQVEF